MGFFNVLSGGFSYLKSIIFKRKETSLENFYINRFGKKLYKMLFEDYTLKVWGRHPSKISPDWGSQRAKGLSVLVVIKDWLYRLLHIKNKKKETSLIESFYYPKYGPGQFWEEVEKKILKKNGEVRKDCTVTKINIKNKKIVSVVYKNKYKEGIDYLLDNNKREDITLYTGYAEGSYPEWMGIKCYIDPRAEVFLKENNKKVKTEKPYQNMELAYNALKNHKVDLLVLTNIEKSEFFYKKYNIIILIYTIIIIINIYYYTIVKNKKTY